MLEKYEQNFNENEFVKSFMDARNFKTKKEALAALRKEIKKESYYQEKIKKVLKTKYPEAFIVKISQSLYSQAGIPDILMIHNGHYFGFEVKRPSCWRSVKTSKRNDSENHCCWWHSTFRALARRGNSGGGTVSDCGRNL